MAFRGHSAVFGNPSNGNYLVILELISQFDSFLKAHIEKIWECRERTAFVPFSHDL